MFSDVLISFIHILSYALLGAIIVRALMSWFSPNDSTGFSRVLLDITEPILAPVRRILPPVSGIDFSPIVALILIQILSYVLVSIVVQTS